MLLARVKSYVTVDGIRAPWTGLSECTQAGSGEPHKDGMSIADVSLAKQA